MIIPSSFRDPSGFLFFRDGNLYRQINKCCLDNFDQFIKSGLYNKLSSKQLLIPHQDADISPENPDTAFKIIKPLPIPFVSYPYEWSFSQLKHAALLTLEIQKISLEYGMTLKDASAYNVQFFQGKPIFIDTLSFERYESGNPWIGYHQFCQHFLAPLALMQYTDIRLGQMLRTYLDGIPLDLTSTLLPKKTWLNLGIVMHIHLHAKSEKKYADVHVPVKFGGVSKNGLLGLLDNLTSTIEKMQWQPEGTEWAEYYQDTNYSKDAFEHKKEVVAHFLELAHSTTVWDIGANNGLFSRLASNNKIPTIAFDIDPACIELNYREILRNKEQDLLPLILDLTNPSPGIGWQNAERDSLIGRGPADTVLALALIHHLAISNNVPLNRIAEFFSRICHSLIIEFVPKSDSQVQKLLMNREDIFDTYEEEHFENAFKRYFTIEQKVPVTGSNRILYLCKNSDNFILKKIRSYAVTENFCNPDISNQIR
jgi:ribosomal protein L11 methylase PrmA